MITPVWIPPFGLSYADWLVRVRRVAWVVGGYFLAESLVLAQNIGSSTATPDLDLIKWGLTQGGLVVVTLTILWTYRKDFRSVLTQKQDQLDTVIELAQECATSIAESSATNRELAAAIERLKLTLPRRRDDAH